MSQDRFLIGAVSTCFILSVAFMSSCTVVNVAKRTEAAKAMLAQGADALDLPCVFDQGTERYCELRAATKALTVKGGNNE